MILCGSLITAQTYSNGPLSTGAMSSNGTAAPAGYTWSELQLSNNTLGAAGYINGAQNFRLADDFTVPAAESWAISSIEVFAYQTGATSQPFNELNLRIVDGEPATGTTVFGDTTTNVFSSSTNSFMYRTGTTPGTTRRIWQLKANVITTLTPGTYWLDYQVHATNDAAAFLPYTAVVGIESPPGANAQQFNTSWLTVQDTGSLTNQELPFIITYVATALGTTETRQLDSRVVVYPNPTADSFKLTLPSESKNANTEISIFDQSGKKVKSFKLADSYNVSDLPKGMYVIKVNDGQNLKATKLIKK